MGELGDREDVDEVEKEFDGGDALPAVTPFPQESRKGEAADHLLATRLALNDAGDASLPVSRAGRRGLTGQLLHGRRVGVDDPGIVRDDGGGGLFGEKVLVILTVGTEEKEAVGVLVVFADDGEDGGHGVGSRNGVARFYHEQ
jgi:hypothetical protein